MKHTYFGKHHTTHNELEVKFYNQFNDADVMSDDFVNAEAFINGKKVYEIRDIFYSQDEMIQVELALTEAMEVYIDSQMPKRPQLGKLERPALKYHFVI